MIQNMNNRGANAPANAPSNVPAGNVGRPNVAPQRPPMGQRPQDNRQDNRPMPASRDLGQAGGVPPALGAVAPVGLGQGQSPQSPWRLALEEARQARGGQEMAPPPQGLSPQGVPQLGAMPPAGGARPLGAVADTMRGRRGMLGY